MQFGISRVNNQSVVLKKGGFKLHSDFWLWHDSWHHKNSGKLIVVFVTRNTTKSSMLWPQLFMQVN
jgi:hypothetical protein